MHMLEPDSDSEKETTTTSTKTTQEHQQQESKSESKSTKVKIEIEEDEDEDDDVEEVPINKKTNKNNQQQQEENQAAKTPATTLPPPQLSGPNKDHYHFQYISNRKPFPFLGGDKELSDLVNKWGLGESMSCLQFSYEMLIGSDEAASSKSAKSVPGQVHAAMLPEFTTALLNSEEFLKYFRCGDGHGNNNGKNATLLHLPSPVTSVKIQNVRAQETTLDMFDRLVAPARGDAEAEAKMHPRMRDLPFQVVRDNGRVCNMPDVFLPCGITVSDQLRGVFMLSEDETECYDAFSEEERNEFLWHVMWRLVSGGAVNQYEDEFEPYKDATREVYKSLVSVGRKKNVAANVDDEDDCETAAANKKNTSTNNDNNIFEVQSLVGLVQDVKCGKSSIKKMLFPKDDRTGNHNFLYVIVDPLRRNCIVWYNAFFSPF